MCRYIFCMNKGNHRWRFPKLRNVRVDLCNILLRDSLLPGLHQNRATIGRKRITIDRQDRRLLRESLKNRKKTSSELAAESSLEINRPVSARTTRRRLHTAGLKGYKARKKPWLSDTNKKNLGTSGP